MKNKLLTILSFCIIFALYSILTTACQNKDVSKTNQSLTALDAAQSLSGENKDKQLQDTASTQNEKPDDTVSPSNIADNSISTNNSSVKSPVSRGGSIPPVSTSQSASKAAVQNKPSTSAKPASSSAAVNSSNSKVELLDWWKDAQYVFPRGASAVVQDLYTGKTFKIVRSMGTNHADSEAASKADTEIIKSIWGGFSWTRRPVIVIINGRRLAASMSAMPHAGIDALPAYQTVDNRSDGYGRGENLDVIKGNGMDGHFDIHFLNSTRHKDNQIDPQHQAMIKIAAGK